MTDQKMYFQWQNPALEQTIYPLRTLNLRNALEYYQEIDLWKQYKGKQISDMPDKVAAYHQRKAEVVKQAKTDYDNLVKVFSTTTIQTSPTTLIKTEAESWVAKIQSLLTAFSTYYSKFANDPFRQSYFITQRLETLDRDRKDLDKRISTQLRYVNILKTMNSAEAKITAETVTLEKLQAVQPLFESWRMQLVALLSAFGKIEGLKKDHLKQVASALKRRDEINVTLLPLQAKIATQAAKFKEAQDEMQRLARRLQPGADSAENYFANPDATTDLARNFPQTDAEFIKQINSMHAEIAALHDPAVKRARLANHIFTLQLNRTRFERRTDSMFKENTLKAYDIVLDQMKDFGSMLAWDGKSKDDLAKARSGKELEKANFHGELQRLQASAAGMQAEVDDLNEHYIEVHDENYLSKYRPIPPMLKDIVELELDDYRRTVLRPNGQEPDQYYLLGLFKERFAKEPQRFPRWLQYMIVHFSGMRYASAHGSWADPKELYLSLRINQINQDLDRNHMNDEAVQQMCQRKIAEYTGGITVTDSDHELPKFASATDAESKNDIAEHLVLLRMDNADAQRRGLLNLRLDEEDYEIKAMTEQDALDGLEGLRKAGLIPDWMWKELSAVTDLRLTDAHDADWEKLTPEEQAQKNDAKWAKYRDILNEWKKDNLTGWREEHDKTNELIVSRAVCNEVAEHILHLRGHKGFSGLSSAADWFLTAAGKDAARLAQNGVGNNVSYFIKPAKPEDRPYYQPGTGILWLKYRNDAPPIWNEVKPFKTSRGETLLPDTYVNGGRWLYKDSGKFRWRSVTKDKGMSVKQEQYLFWVHVATVAEVAEPTDGAGTIVLTYETNLPYEDRRRSCVGVFKRYLHNLLFDGGEDAYNGSYIGFVPDNTPDIPNEDLDEMLNWDHILLKT